MQLVINTYGACLRKRGERFVINAGDRELSFSAHKVRSVLLVAGVMLTSDAVQLAHQHNIDIVFLDGHGDPYGRIWQTRMGSTAAIRRRQLETMEGLAFVRGWIKAKLRHQQEFLLELARRRPGAASIFQSPLMGVQECLQRLATLTGTIDDQRGTILGLEGTAGRLYFTCLSQLVPEAYRFEGRSRHPARDGFNAMLNYAYGVLYSLVEKACICAGLDPFLGFLHTDNYNKPSLVFDLIEPFRILADRTVVLLFTGRRVQTDFFAAVPGGIALAAPGRAALLASFNERLEKTLRYPVQGRPHKTRYVKQRAVIQHEAHGLANMLLGRRDLPLVVETRRVWDEDITPAPTDPEEDPPTLAEGDAPC